MTIVSFQHGYLFIKTRKVAGTSVEAVLRRHTGPDDIVPALTPRDELHCARLGLDAKNYARDREAEARYRALVLEESFDDALALSGKMRKAYTPHMTARELRRRLGRRNFSSLYRFSIERNPFTWLVSLVAYDARAYNTGTLPTFDVTAIRERIAERLSRRRLLETANYGYYTIRGRLAVDRVLRYEHLVEDLQAVLRHVGIETTVALPKLKMNPQEASLDEIYTQELAARVVERFKPVFELMGYPERVG